ncbi:hypothetical protein K8T06_17455 [bacterium]|nr:hypothetical protein [bacterium]
MNSSQSTRQYIEIALFGAIGGALEAVLGSITYSFRFIPFVGLIPATALIFVLSAFYTKNHCIRDVAYCGATIAVLKLLSPGGTSIFPIIGVLAETCIICLIFWIIPGKRLIRILIAGATISLWPICHKIIHLSVFLGIAAPEIIYEFATKSGGLLGTENTGIFWLLLPIILFHFFIGAAGAFLGWLLGKKLHTFRTQQS